MTIIICPGIHHPSLTESFLRSLKHQAIELENSLIFPADRYPPFSALSIWQFLQQQPTITKHQSLVFISFSAGVVGAIGAAWLWQQSGGKIEAFIALDGWGVPVWGDFPIYRCSHDYYTHWSSLILGGGRENFYAEPPVEHLELWQSPHTVAGWSIGLESKTRTTAATFIINSSYPSLLLR